MIGELHHPVVPRESERPSWLVVPETGLYTGVLIVGAVGSGKTSACMYPFAQQLLSWQADRPARRASALVLEVKGDFCHDVRRILEKAGRGDDYLEIGLGGAWQWNPLDDPLLDTYSLAYSVASLINQLFGKSREPFWQQAYTNLVRWIIELHRLLPGGWVTLQDVSWEPVAGTEKATCARTRDRRAAQERLDTGAAAPARRGRPPARTLPPAPPSSSATSTRRSPPWARTIPRATRRRSRSRGSAAASRSSPRSRSPRSAPCCRATDAWRTLVQTLRTRIFLSLSDESSARIASEMCGSVMKTQPSYTFTETTGRPEFSLLSGRAGGGRGTIGASKSFRQAREPVFTPRDFTLLANYQAICLPYDGTRSLPARRVYLKPHYLPRERGYWRLGEEGRI